MLTFAGNSKSSAKNYDSLKSNPHREVQTILEGALDKISKARAALRAHRVTDKGMYIGMTINLLDALRISLNAISGDLLCQFRAEYEEMQYQLLQANIRNDERALVTVATKLQNIKSNWETIPKKFHYVSNKRLIVSAVENNHVC
jgi:flagellar protein FliS